MNGLQPDETDWSLIEILRHENVPNNQAAQELGVSEGTVRQRLKRLKEAEILVVRALINPDVLENRQLAILGVNIAESRLLDEKAREIAELEEVLSVSVVSGRYDMLVEVLVDSNRGLVNFLTGSLSGVAGVVKTETFVTLRSYGKYV